MAGPKVSDADGFGPGTFLLCHRLSPALFLTKTCFTTRPERRRLDNEFRYLVCPRVDITKHFSGNARVPPIRPYLRTLEGRLTIQRRDWGKLKMNSGPI